MSCSAVGCRNRPADKQKDISFHRFPDDEHLKKKWVIAMKRMDLQNPTKLWVPTQSSRLCSKHFLLNDFDPTSPFRKRLKSDAVPSVFAHSSEKCVKEREIPVRHSPTPLSIENINRKSSLKKIIKEKVEEVDTIQNERDILEKELREQLKVKDQELLLAKQKLQLKDEEIAQLNKSIGSKNAIILQHRKKLKRLKNKSGYLKRKISTISNLLKELQNRNFILEEQGCWLEGISPTTFAIVKRQHLKSLNPKMREKYDEKLRAFSITLQFLSSKAYDFIRSTFNTSLPHPKTLSSWYKNVNGDPGVNTQALQAIKDKIEATNYQLVFALMLDGMSIKKQTEWKNNKLYGHINIGCDNNDETTVEAREALFFYIVCVNSTWKIPVAYFLIDKINGMQLHSLVTTILNNLADYSIEVSAIISDGLAANLSMIKKFGCCFDLNLETEGPITTESLNTNFTLERTGNEIQVMLDICHSIKLVRNAWAHFGVIIDGDGGEICWQYVKNLLKLQEEIGFKLGNKLSKSHVHFQNRKMKVKFAAQVLSSSIADAMQVCKQYNVKGFEQCDATVKFLKTFDKLFDIFNSRSIKNRFTKQALHPGNIEETLQFLREAEQYIISLRGPTGSLLVAGPRKCGFIGFLVAIKTIPRLYQLYVKTRILNYLPTYKYSQDHLERLFGYIRSRNGHNDSPSAFQLCYIVKKILIHKQLHEGHVGTGNAIPLDKIEILNPSKQKPWNELNNIVRSTHVHEIDDEEFIATGDELTDHSYVLPYSDLSFSALDIDVIEYIGGYVIRWLTNKLKCSHCIEALTSINGEIVSNALIRIKNRGGLITPNYDTSILLKICEQVLRQQTKLNISHFTPGFVNELKTRILHLAQTRSLYSKFVHFEEYGNHFVRFLECIIIKYLDIRIRGLCNQKNDSYHFKSKRITFHKLTLFSNF